MPLHGHRGAPRRCNAGALPGQHSTAGLGGVVPLKAMTETHDTGANARDGRDEPDSQEPSDSDDPTPTVHELTGFQRDLLAVLVVRTDADEETPGQRVKEALEARGYEDVNHGRLYPNLDGLAEDGLIRKDALAYDRRTNEYRPTERGRELVTRYAAALADDVGLETEGSA